MTKTKHFRFFYYSPKVAYPLRLYGIKKITTSMRSNMSHLGTFLTTSLEWSLKLEERMDG
jgi:hypothetical protein